MLRIFMWIVLYAQSVLASAVAGGLLVLIMHAREKSLREKNPKEGCYGYRDGSEEGEAYRYGILLGAELAFAKIPLFALLGFLLERKKSVLPMSKEMNRTGGGHSSVCFCVTGI